MSDRTMQQIRDDVSRARSDPSDPGGDPWRAIQAVLDELADLRERVRLLELAREGPADLLSPPLKG